MRGGGRGGGGGGGTAPHAAAAEGAAAIPLSSRKLVQHLKGILADRSEAEIYATLLDCAMDPDIAVERLISQDSFHEVRRKRDKKKEIKASQETRARPFYKPTYRGSKAGSEQSGRFYSGFRDSASGVKGPMKKEAELHYPSNPSILDSVKSSNPVETISATGNNESSIVSSAQADAKSNTFQPPSQLQHGWGGIPGRPSMADIVKMGRPQAKLGGRSIANNTTMPIVGGPVMSNAPNSASKDSRSTVLSSNVNHGTVDKPQNSAVQVNSASKVDTSVDILPPGHGSDVPESFSATSMSANIPESTTPGVKEGGVGKGINLEETKEMNASNAKVVASTCHLSVPDKELQSECTQNSTHLNYDLIDKTNSNDDVSTARNQFEHLNVLEEKAPKSSEDNPAVIIPDHLQVSNADCAHLTFGSFVSGTLDASLSIKPTTIDGEVATVSDNHSIDQSDVRIHEYENKETITSRANEYVDSTTNSDVKDLDLASVQEPEVRRPDVINVTNHAEYNLPSNSDYVTSTSVQPDSAARTYLQENRQMQNISPLSSFMHGNIPNGLLPPAIPPLRELDPAFSLLLTNPPLATIINGASATSSSMSNTMVSTQTQENVHPGGLSNPQLTQSQPSNSIASGPPLPHHIALHPYAQATLPLGYASMIGYPSLPQSYAYLPPAALQQPYMNSALFHQAAAAVPNSSIKYPLPQYKNNVALASLPQPASLPSSYVGGFGTTNTIPGNFALNQSTASATTTLGFDGTVPSQYKDGNHFGSLQQSENPAIWMHGAGARAMPPLTANTLYGYQGQGGLRQGQLPSQFGGALGQSQPGLGPEHRNPSDSNLSAAAAQANQMWPNSY